MGRGLTRNHLGEEIGPDLGLQPCSSAPLRCPAQTFLVQARVHLMDCTGWECPRAMSKVMESPLATSSPEQTEAGH